MVVYLSLLFHHCAVRPRESLSVVHSVWRVTSSSSRFQDFLRGRFFQVFLLFTRSTCWRRLRRPACRTRKPPALRT